MLRLLAIASNEFEGLYVLGAGSDLRNRTVCVLRLLKKTTGTSVKPFGVPARNVRIFSYIPRKFYILRRVRRVPGLTLTNQSVGGHPMAQVDSRRSFIVETRVDARPVHVRAVIDNVAFE